MSCFVEKWYSCIFNSLLFTMKCKWYNIGLFNISHNKVNYKRSCRIGLFNKPNRFYSTSSSVPIKNYANADTDKVQIIKENKSKAGVYR